MLKEILLKFFLLLYSSVMYVCIVSMAKKMLDVDTFTNHTYKTRPSIPEKLIVPQQFFI